MERELLFETHTIPLMGIRARGESGREVYGINTLTKLAV
jgi:hypothetical protein